MNNFYSRELEKMDHGEYDAHFIKAWKSPRFPWVQPDFEGESPFKRQHFMEHTRDRLLQHLPGYCNMAGQRLDRNRTVVSYMASEMVFHSANRVHLRQCEPEVIIKRIRDDFAQCLREKQLVTASSDSLLWEQGMRFTQTNNLPAYRIPLDSKWDRILLERVTGKSVKDLHALMDSATPELVTLDRSHVHIYEEEFRRNMWNLLLPYHTFNDDLRAEMRSLTLNAWMSKMDDAFMQQIHQIEHDLQQRTGKAMNLLGDKGGHDSASCRKFLDMYTSILYQDTHAEEDLATLRRWFRGVEYLLILAAEEEEVSFIQELNKVMHETEGLLHLSWHEYPSIAFAEFAGATHATHINEGQELRPHNLLTFL